MASDQINSYIDENYADYIIDYRTNPKIQERFPGAIIHNINDTYAVLHLPVTDIDSVKKERRILYTPNTFGLTSESSLAASGVEKLRSIAKFNLKGQGVLVGIIDTGIDYKSPVFLGKDGNTRIQSIWDQTIESDLRQPSQVTFGTQYLAEQVNQAIKSEQPLSVVPSIDENGHGTMLAAITAGSENRKEGFYGVAPEAELVVVKLRQTKKYLRDYYAISENIVCYSEHNIMWGVQYCLGIARQLKRPIAICIGLGSSQSAHDGMEPLSRQLAMYADFPGVGIVISGGNEGNLGRHFHGSIDPSVGSIGVEMNVGEMDKEFSLQLWGESPGLFSIEITSPTGEFVPRITASLQIQRKISFVFERTEIYVEYQTVESRTGDELILLNFHNTTAGIWSFKVYHKGDLTGNFHMWLPMGNFISKDTYFVQPDIYTTILAPGNSVIPITVTAYNPVNGGLYVNSSRGYSRTEMIKPEFAAPGVNYIAPSLNGSFTTFTGTGVAAAHTTGVVALLLEWGIVQKNETYMDTHEIKKYLIRGAGRSSNMNYPNKEWGYGTLNIYNAFDVLRTVMD